VQEVRGEVHEVQEKVQKNHDELELKLEGVKKDLSEKLELKLEGVKKELSEKGQKNHDELELKLEGVKKDLSEKVQKSHGELELKLEGVKKDVIELSAKGQNELEQKIQSGVQSVRKDLADIDGFIEDRANIGLLVTVILELRGLRATGHYCTIAGRVGFVINHHTVKGSGGLDLYHDQSPSLKKVSRFRCENTDLTVFATCPMNARSALLNITTVDDPPTGSRKSANLSFVALLVVFIMRPQFVKCFVGDYGRCARVRAW
jgi:hypothetical protein